MRFGANAFTATPFGSSDLDFSVLPSIVDLIEDQEAPRAYLFHAAPYDPVSVGEVNARASIGLQRPIVDAAAWPAILQTAADVQIDLYGDGEASQGQANFGNLKLLLGGGEHYALINYFWDGRAVDIQLGAEGFDAAEYVDVLCGTAADITYSKRELNVIFRGKEEFLRSPVQETEYTGAGGLEGGDDLAGSLKPRAYGIVRNMTPVLVDRVNQIYQFNDGSSEAVTAALDGGAALLPEGDVADIEAAAVTPGYYKTQLSGGYVKLGAVPAKALTLDVMGSNSGGYVDTITDIIRRVVLDSTELAESDLNLQSFETARLDSWRATGGVLITSETADTVITELVASIGGAWTFNRLGKLTLGVFRFRRATRTITSPDIIEGSVQRRQATAKSWRRWMGYARAWTVQTDDQFVGLAPDAQRDFAAREYRFATAKTPSIRTAHPAAAAVGKDTLLAEFEAAAAIVQRQQDLFSSEFERIDLVARRQQFKHLSGDTVTIDYPDLGIDSRDMIILGIREHTGTQRTTLRLWGAQGPVVYTDIRQLFECVT